VLFVLLQVICVGVLSVVQTSLVRGSWSSSWAKEACLTKMVFCTCFSCKTPWEVEPQIRLEYPRIEKRKKDITISKEGHVLVFLFYYFSFLFPTSYLLTVVTKAATTIAKSSSSWLLGYQRQFIGRSRGTRHL